MSQIFGVLYQDERTVGERLLLDMGGHTARFVRDGTFVRAAGRIGMGFQPYHTHERSKLEHQPIADDQGNVVAVDGRLDNYEELIDAFGIPGEPPSDSVLILKAFEVWGEGCFSRFVGDWAIALWNKADNSLFLARDHAGTRVLYYEAVSGVVRWGTYLETLIPEGCTPHLSKGFAARYLACYPIYDLTPFEDIFTVPPAHYLKFRNGNAICRPHWNWRAKTLLHYNDERSYEEHFLSLFRQSVKRRTIGSAPILAQLSGGMDSTAIVCMSDRLKAEGTCSPRTLIDTISFYDDSEPHWDERPFFRLVEERRGKTGIHLPVSLLESSYSIPESSEGRFLYPGATEAALDREKQFNDAIEGKGYRVILSGIGGDEVLGGAPNPLPELGDHLASGNFPMLIKRAFAWSLPNRTPLLQILVKTICFTFRCYFAKPNSMRPIPPWLACSLPRFLEATRYGDDETTEKFGYRPSAITSGRAWWSIMESLPIPSLQELNRLEYRYPYLDKDLVNYLFSLPPQVLLGPDARRYLMRNALFGIVPDEILKRRRKAFMIRGPVVSLQRNMGALRDLLCHSGTEITKFVDPQLLEKAIVVTAEGEKLMWMNSISRAIAFELWLRRRKRQTYPSGNQGRLCDLSQLDSASSQLVAG